MGEDIDDVLKIDDTEYLSEVELRYFVEINISCLSSRTCNT